MSVRRRLEAGAVIAGCVLLAGCGGGGIPEDASVKEFCKAGDAFAKATKFPDGVKAANELHDTGTPKGIPDDARDGFELVVKLVTDSDDQADLEKRYKKLTATEKKSVEQLDAYIAKTC
jgi:PBP1b-binding outer membrane lipoprotein LpoB